jgi:hypothetical protein
MLDERTVRRALPDLGSGQRRQQQQRAEQSMHCHAPDAGRVAAIVGRWCAIWQATPPQDRPRRLVKDGGHEHHHANKC